MKKIFTAALFASFLMPAFAQQVVPCVTDQTFVESTARFPEIAVEAQKAGELASRTPELRKAGTVRYIPVVFHVIHKYGLENITQAQINDAIRVMNEDFRKKTGTSGGSSTDPLAVDMEYEFRIAQLDPNGQPTSGVNRIYNVGTDNARDSQKSISYWDAKKYFNIWVVNTIQNNGDPTSRVLGYAQFPFQINSQTSTDGIMVCADQAGMIDRGDVSQAGRTLTHEAGHWVGLYHPFQGGCVGGTSTNCATQGDQVCDTPPVASPTTGCPTSRNSCSNDVPDLPDQIKNYMDYADGTCMNMYTAGQKTRADQLMAAYRSNIYSTSNLGAAGINTDGSYKTLTPATIKAPYSFGFNTASLAGTGWTLENYMSPGDSGWQINNTLGAAGSGCLASKNLLNWRTNIRNAFSSPNMDLTAMTNPTLSFYVAYAKRSTVSGCRVRVWVSDNYGRTEVLAKTYLASEMETGAISTSPFTPSSSEWKRLVVDLTPYKSYTNCRIRFELQSLRGNNIYFDEFAVTEPLSVADRAAVERGIEVFPNPAQGKVSVSLTEPRTGMMEITLTDLQGKTVLKHNAVGEGTAGQEIQLSLDGTGAGLYLLQVHTREGSFVKRLRVE